MSWLPIALGIAGFLVVIGVAAKLVLKRRLDDIDGLGGAVSCDLTKDEATVIACMGDSPADGRVAR